MRLDLRLQATLRRPGVSLVAPAVLFLMFFLVLPLLAVLALSFLETRQYEIVFNLNLGNYAAILGSWTYVRPLLRSVAMASAVSICSLFVALPVAVWIASSRYRLPLVLLTAAPFLAGEMLRITALQLLLAPAGIFELALARLGFSGDAALMYSDVGTFVGLVYVWLPFMILSLYLSLLKFDFSYEHVAATCGANWWRRYYEVVLPLNKAGLGIGLAVVFIPSLGSSIEPRFLGGPDGSLYGMILASQRNFGTWARGAAMGFVLLCLSLIALSLFLRIAWPDLIRWSGFREEARRQP